MLLVAIQRVFLLVYVPEEMNTFHPPETPAESPEATGLSDTPKVP
jgi:hypothetical protein